MSYLRVIPRDLFNESSLLKCYGRLYIVMEGLERFGHFLEDAATEFDIQQREDDGFIYIENLPFIAGRYSYRLTRPLNSRETWPLYAERIDDMDFEAVSVFTDAGDLTEEMKHILNLGSN